MSDFKQDATVITPSWKLSHHPAHHWQALGGDLVQCHLCPRHCTVKEGRFGFCGVRGSVGNELRTFNFGKSVTATEEVIETEAVYHYRPGARILSLGNIGCMMACDYCHNWETSQVAHLNPSQVRQYQPEEVIAMAQAAGIEVISWTYNDPVVWHEFILETSRLAHAAGIRTLYKSAFYIEEKPAAELIDVIDIFSLSLKSMSEEFYRKITRGRLQPVLDRICQIHASGRHLELSQLVVPGLNDAEEDIRKTVAWVLKHVGPLIPLHFVAFHPAYRYTSVGRTPVDLLLKAQAIAREAGIQYCYLGNVYRNSVSDTHCPECGALAIRRFGLSAEAVGLDDQGKCLHCGHALPIIEPHASAQYSRLKADMPDKAFEATHKFPNAHFFRWTEEWRSLHIQAPSQSGELYQLRIQHGDTGRVRKARLGNGIDRIIVTRENEGDLGVLIEWTGTVELQFLPVLDRAHFPVDAQTQV